VSLCSEIYGTTLTAAEAHQKIDAELDKVWPEWRGVPGSIGQIVLRLEQRGEKFDYSLINVGARLSIVKHAIDKALGDHAGICVFFS